MNQATILSFASLNINGTKDKDLLINELLVHDIVFLQEHLLTKSNVSSLKRSSVHHFFSQEAKQTRGRPSGGLAIFFRSPSKPSVIHCDDNILAIQCDSTDFINVYLPCDRRSIASFTSFAKCCSSLKSLLESLRLKDLNWVLAGDLNCDILGTSDRSILLLESLPSIYHVAVKSLPFTYIHNRGCSKSNLDHVISSSSSLISSIVRVDEEKIDDDHLILSCNLSCELSGKILSAQPKWHMKLNWDRANVPLYLARLTALLSTIKVPYHLLQTSVSSPSSTVDLNFYYCQIVHCLKSASKAAVPVDKVRIGTRKPNWNVDPEVKRAKQKAKFWLRMWISCDRPSSGAVFSVKQKCKLEYKASLKRARLNAWPGPTDKASWNKVINSEKCSPSTLSCLQLANFVDHYKRVFSVFNSFLQSFYYKLLKPLLPYRLLQAHVQPVAISEIRRALRKIKRSNSLDGDGLSYRFFAYDCPALLNHLQIFL